MDERAKAKTLLGLWPALAVALRGTTASRGPTPTGVATARTRTEAHSRLRPRRRHDAGTHDGGPSGCWARSRDGWA